MGCEKLVGISIYTDKMDNLIIFPEGIKLNYPYSFDYGYYSNLKFPYDEKAFYNEIEKAYTVVETGDLTKNRVSRNLAIHRGKRTRRNAMRELRYVYLSNCSSKGVTFDAHVKISPLRYVKVASIKVENTENEKELFSAFNKALTLSKATLF